MRYLGAVADCSILDLYEVADLNTLTQNGART